MVEPLVNAIFSATIDQLALKLIKMREKHEGAQKPNYPSVVPAMVQARLGRKRRRAPLITTTKRLKYFSN